MPSSIPLSSSHSEGRVGGGFADPKRDATLIDITDVRGVGERLTRQIEFILKTRAARFEFFPSELFADPAWDLLLTLALAELRQHRLTISNLCDATNVPASTAARWIRSLTDSGWLVRRDCPLDARVKYIELSHSASKKVREYVEQTSAIWAKCQN